MSGRTFVTALHVPSGQKPTVPQGVVASSRWASRFSASTMLEDGTTRRTIAGHGMTQWERRRVVDALDFMHRRRADGHLLFATVGDAVLDLPSREARAVIQRFASQTVTYAKRAGLPPYWMVVLETEGGLHGHVVFVGRPTWADVFRAGAFAPYFERQEAIQPVPEFDRPTYGKGLQGLGTCLTKESTPQAAWSPGGLQRGRRRGSHRLDDGGDRVRLSKPLREDALSVNAIEPWTRTNAGRGRKVYRPPSRNIGQSTPDTRPIFSGQGNLFPELERPIVRLRDYAGGLMSPALAAKIEHERYRRDLTQTQLADLFGIRQPQLANILRGHDGASRWVANRMRETLSAHPKPISCDAAPHV